MFHDAQVAITHNIIGSGCASSRWRPLYFSSLAWRPDDWLIEVDSRLLQIIYDPADRIRRLSYVSKQTDDLEPSTRFSRDQSQGDMDGLHRHLTPVGMSASLR